ncbi:Bll5482 protein [hydrothermal vent metagenome]|uniref:Bll5482 protein n=1 Tax=hydrothermal vent metagenome TaxID=652676 RepID=A0A3B0T4N0_9ZZZZ
MTVFWKSAGLHLVTRAENGWLNVTPDYLRAYFTRPELHPVEESCAAEHALFEALMADPFATVSKARIEALADADAAENYRTILRFRDLLAGARTVEGAYLALFAQDTITIPPLFVGQMVHLILAGLLEGETDPMRLRAAELFFREQRVTTGNDQLMLADAEIVDMKIKAGGLGGLGQLLAETGTPARQVTLDVLDDDNKDLYWQRSDRFDTAIDFRFTQPALDAFARMIEAWVRHFRGTETQVQAMASIADERWSWHVGLDAEATGILNALYNGQDLDEAQLVRIIGLFRMEFLHAEDLTTSMQGKPVYLGLAMSASATLKMKPQNLLTNLPLAQR